MINYIIINLRQKFYESKNEKSADYLAESFNWNSLDLEKHSWTPGSDQSLFMAPRSSSVNGSVSSMRAMTSSTILASACNNS